MIGNGPENRPIIPMSLDACLVLFLPLSQKSLWKVRGRFIHSDVVRWAEKD
jgi:hypothetical protein